MKLGGNYRATKNPDGTWNIYDVPVFPEHERTFQFMDRSTGETRQRHVKVDRAYLDDCVAKSRRSYAEGYASPLHIGHHDPTGDPSAPQPVPAGKVTFTRVGPITYQGQRLMCMFADLLEVPEHIYQEIKAGSLPWRSVEIIKFENRQVDSLALLTTQPPFFELPLLSVHEETPTEFAEVYRADAGLVRAMRASAHGAMVLCYFADGDEKKPDDKDREGDKGDARPGEQGDGAPTEGAPAAGAQPHADPATHAAGLGGQPNPTNPPADAGAGMEVNMSKEILTALQSIANGQAQILQHLQAATPAPAAKPTGNAGAVDVAAQAAKAIEAQYSTKLVEMQAKIDTLTAKDTARDAETKLLADVRATIKDLAAYNLGADPETRLLAMAKEHGAGSLKTYAEAIKRHGVPEPPKDLATQLALDGAGLPKEVLAYQAKGGPEAVSRALQASKLYDAASDVLKRGLTREQWIASYFRHPAMVGSN